MLRKRKPVSLSPTVEKRIAEVEAMTLHDVQRLMTTCMKELAVGRITARECRALTSAAGKRIKALKAELLT
jgi:hypothetical protein